MDFMTGKTENKTVLSDFKNFEIKELNENYRNARQITEYCKKRFKMKMTAINLDGNGVHELCDFSEYEEKLLSAKNEADGIIKSAVETADRRSESIVNEANEKVRYIMEKSQKQIEQDKQNAVTDAKREIASMAVDAAEKIIGKKLTDSDDEELISDIIDRM